jgi:hypothetical protein
MKEIRNRLLALAIVCLLVFGVGYQVSQVSTGSVALAQKEQAAKKSVDIDSTIAPLTGKRVMYVLTDDEGGALLESTGQGRKVPAIITYNYRVNRNADGNLISPLTIFRPASIGGLLLRDDVPSDSSRSPGTWDNFQPGDLRN